MKGETTTTMAINMTMRKYWTVVSRKVEVTIKHYFPRIISRRWCK